MSEEIIKNKKIIKYYFTFGFGQRYENCFTVIEANDYGEARDIMFEMFGKKWAFQYDEEHWILPNGKTQQEEYNLREIY